MGFTGKKIAVDLGSTTTRIYVPRKGLVLVEPTIIARDEETDEIVAFGSDAIEMAGRSPETIIVSHPLQAGVIADYKATTALLKHYLGQSMGRFQIKKPEAMITVSGTATSTERRALIDAGIDAGLQEVHLIKGAVASALGSGLPITEPRGNVIVDIGGGTTEIGVFSLGGVVAQESIRIGGNSINDAIQRLLRREHGTQIGISETERLKSTFLDMGNGENITTTVHGRNTLQGLPKSTDVRLGQLQAYSETALERIVFAIRRVLEKTPPDLISDIIKHGVIISGGSSQIKNLDHYFGKRLNVAFMTSQDPELSSIKGAHIALTHLSDYKRSLLT